MSWLRSRLVLEVNDVAESIRHYTDVLGFELASVRPEAGPPEWARLDAGQASFVFVPRADPEAPPVLTGSIYVYPEDVDRAWETLRDRAEITWPIQTWPYGMRDFGVRDCNGYWLTYGQAVEDPRRRVGSLDLPSLVRRAQAKDEAAFGTLVLRFQHMAVSYAFARLGDGARAEDAAQEAFLEAYVNLAKLRAPEAFAVWLKKIVWKHCDRITRRATLATRPLDTAAEPAAADDPAGELERRRQLAVVREAVEALPEHERVVTALFYVFEQPQEDIAELLEVPVSTVKNRLFSARRRLKEELLPLVGESLADLAPSMEDCVAERVHRILDRLARADATEGEALIAGHPGLGGVGDD